MCLISLTTILKGVDLCSIIEILSSKIITLTGKGSAVHNSCCWCVLHIYCVHIAAWSWNNTFYGDNAFIGLWGIGREGGVVNCALELASKNVIKSKKDNDLFASERNQTVVFNEGLENVAWRFMVVKPQKFKDCDSGIFFLSQTNLPPHVGKKGRCWQLEKWKNRQLNVSFLWMWTLDLADQSHIYRDESFSFAADALEIGFFVVPVWVYILRLSSALMRHTSLVRSHMYCQQCGIGYSPAVRTTNTKSTTVLRQLSCFGVHFTNAY